MPNFSNPFNRINRPFIHKNKAPGRLQQWQLQRALAKNQKKADLVEQKNIRGQVNALTSITDDLLEQVKKAPHQQKPKEIKQTVLTVTNILAAIIKRSR
jgi:hypothetical protein